MVDREHFRQELPGWLLRGAACALPSTWFGLGVVEGRIANVVAMLAGFLLVVAAFAEFCARPAVRSPDNPPWSRALRIAAWIRAGLNIGPGIYLDLLTGALSVDLFGVRAS